VPRNDFKVTMMFFVFHIGESISKNLKSPPTPTQKAPSKLKYLKKMFL